MPFQPFHSEPAQHRAVLLPPDLAAETRQKLLTRLVAAAKQQAALAGQCDAVLRARGDVIDAGGMLLIPHEPACPLLPAQVVNASERPDVRTLQWFTWAGLRALRAAAADNICHGGLMLAALYRDELGRIRVGDFGVAPAFEFAFGMDARRGVHCESGATRDEQGRAISGEWALRPDEERETGWIAPYFGHELTEGKVRLNPKGDQFALGTILFLLATGTHPYGAALSDPHLMFYFQLEPYNVADERKDWRPIFERLEKGLTQAADRPLLAWWEVLLRLLATDPGERYASLADAEKQIAESIPPEWPQAWDALGEAVQKLEAGDAEAALDLASPWADHEALPELWREPLRAWHARLASQKDAIVRQRQAERTLREAQEALNSVNLPRARGLASSLVHAHDVAEDVRSAAREVLQHCEEQEKFVESESAPLAQAYLQAAREALAAGDVQPAREILNGVLGDPSTPPPLAAQARELLSEIELSQRREEQQRADMATALQEMEDGRYEAASQRVEGLLADTTLPEALAEQARGLKSQIDQFRRRRGEHAAALEDARTAWENSDLETLRAKLADVDPQFPDPQIADVREDLAQRAVALQQALRIRDTAVKRHEAGDHAGVMDVLRRVARDGLPQRLLDTLAELRRTAEEAERARRQAEIDAARAQLDDAQRRLDLGEMDACEHIIAALPEAVRELDAALGERADELLRACDDFRRAAEMLAAIHRDISARRFDAARKQLAAAPVGKLPAALRARRVEIEQELDAAYLAHLEAQQQELERRVSACEQALADGHLDEVERLAREAGQSPYLNDAMGTRLKRVAAELRQLRAAQASIEKTERELARGAEADTAGVFAQLDALSKDLPKWLLNRADLARTKAQQIRKAQERAAREAAVAALNAADASLEAGNADEADAALSRVSKAALHDDGLRERHASLTTSTAALRPWLRRLEDVERKINDEDLLGAQRDAGAMLKDQSVPPGARKRLERLDAAVRQQIAAARGDLDASLGKLRRDLEQRGRRARHVPRDAAAIQAFALATEEQKAGAAELVDRYEALPKPKMPVMPMVVAGVLIVGAIGAGALLMRPKPPPPDPNRTSDSNQLVADPNRAHDGNQLVVVDPNPGDANKPVEPSDVDRLAKAAVTLRGELTRILAGEASSLQVRFDPENEIPTTLIVENGGRTVRRRNIRRDELGSLALTNEELKQLRPPPAPTDAELIAAGETRLRGELAAAAGADEVKAELSFSHLNAFPTTLTIRRADRSIDVEFAAAQPLAAYRITAEVYARLIPDEPPPALIDANRYAADVQQALAGEAAKLPGARENAQLRDVTLTAGQPADNRFAVDVKWAGRSLGTISVQFDPAADSYAPAASEAAAAFLPQMRAVAALAQPNLRIATRPRYEDALQLDDPIASATVQMDAQGGAAVSAKVRFRAARERSLSVEGTLRDGVLTLSEASLRAFDQQVAAMQKESSDALVDVLAAGLGVQSLPPGVEAVVKPDEDAAEISVQAGGRTVATVSAPWDRESLTYKLDGSAAARAVLDALRDEARDAAAAPSLQTGWPAFVDSMQLPDGQPGVGYLKSTAVEKIEPVVGSSLGELLRPGAKITLNRPGGAAEDAIAITASLKRVGGAWGWDEAEVATAAAAIQKELNRFAGDAAFRQRRAEEAIGALRQEGAADIGAAERGRDSLKLEAKVNGKPSEVRWTWDSSELAWTGRTIEAKSEPTNNSTTPNNTTPSNTTPATLESRLAALSGPAASAQQNFREQMAGVLADIASDKAARYKVTGKYGLAPSLAQGDGAARLRNASQIIQRTAAPNPGVDPFPTVFVEIWTGQQNVYAIGWRAVTGGGDQISGVEGLQVRLVMPTTSLAQFSSAEQLRQELARNAQLGNALLGDFLGSPIQGSNGGSFGVAIAPDGAFWVVPWDQVAFTSRGVANVNDRGAGDAGAVSRTRDLLRGSQKGRDEFSYRRVGLWCVPALFGQAAPGFNPAAANLRFNLGPVIPGRSDEPSSVCRTRDSATFMPISLPEGRDAEWGIWVRSVTQADIGYSFWNRQWNPPTGANANWMPTPNINFALVQPP